MTTWLCISPSTTLLLLLTILPSLLVFYCLMDKKPSTKYVSKTTTHGNIPYSALNSAEQDHNANLRLQEKIQIVWGNATLFLSLCIGYACEYLTIQSIVTTVAFPSAPFNPRDHYQYYTVFFVTGEFVGRSYALLVSLMRCKIPAVTSHTWVFSSILAVVALFLVFVAWYHFLHNVFIVLALLFVLGLNAGALYTNSFTVASRGSSSRHVEFSRSFLNLAITIGIISAGFLGIYVEPLLKAHCQHTVLTPEFCITRLEHKWNTSISCLGTRN